MKKILIVGSGIAGLSCAIHCAEAGMEVTLVSPFPSERAQSVLAAGGINAVLKEGNDSIQSHIEDTLRGGLDMAGENAVRGLCESAPCIIEWLEKLGTVFSVESDGTVARRSFGGQSHARTCYCGSSTGKQIVSALVMEARRYEGLGQIHRLLWRDFYSALILDGVCYGAILYNESTQKTEIIRADYVVIATGGQNALFGRTTGSTLCDGYASGKLFMQGVELKNLESADAVLYTKTLGTPVAGVYPVSSDDAPDRSKENADIRGSPRRGRKALLYGCRTACVFYGKKIRRTRQSDAS